MSLDKIGELYKPDDIFESIQATKLYIRNFAGVGGFFHSKGFDTLEKEDLIKFGFKDWGDVDMNSQKFTAHKNYTLYKYFESNERNCLPFFLFNMKSYGWTMDNTQSATFTSTINVSTAPKMFTL